MGKFSNVFFASDFDHTLTGKDNVLRQRNVEAIRYFMSEGGMFTVVSGRSIPLFATRAELVPVNAPCILYNGAACYDYSSKKLHYAQPIADIAMDIIRYAHQLDESLYMEIQGVENHYSCGYNAQREAFLGRESFIPLPLNENVPKPWMKVTICVPMGTGPLCTEYTPEELAYVESIRSKLDAFCAGRCYVVRSLPYMVEIGNPNCSKGAAARTLAKQYGREILVCAGDAPNDISMLDEADIAFSPADRDETLRKKPYHEVAACGDGAVADAIEKLEQML